jgi:hypothetical protein
MTYTRRLASLMLVALVSGCIGAGIARVAPASAQPFGFPPGKYVCTDSSGNLSTDCSGAIINSPVVIGREQWKTTGISDTWTVGVWPDPGNQSSISFYRGGDELFAMHGADGGFYSSYLHVNVTGPVGLCASQAGIINAVGGGTC